VALGKLLTRVCHCHQAVKFGTGQGAVMLCGWEENESLTTSSLERSHLAASSRLLGRRQKKARKPAKTARACPWHLKLTANSRT